MLAGGERYDVEGSGEALRGEFRALLDRTSDSCREEFETLLVEARRTAEAGEPLDGLLTAPALTRACLRERARGVPSNKIARAQIHRNLSRSILSSLLAFWLLQGTVPAAPADQAVRMPRLRPDVRRAPAGFHGLRPGSATELLGAIDAVTNALEAISVPKATILPALRRSNCAVGIVAPYLVLRRHGCPARIVRPALTRFIEEIAPLFAGEILWRDDTGFPETRPVRKTCCLKYTCGSRRFCGTCPKRD